MIRVFYWLWFLHKFPSSKESRRSLCRVVDHADQVSIAIVADLQSIIESLALSLFESVGYEVVIVEWTTEGLISSGSREQQVVLRSSVGFLLGLSVPSTQEIGVWNLTWCTGSGSANNGKKCVYELSRIRVADSSFSARDWGSLKAYSCLSREVMIVWFVWVLRPLAFVFRATPQEIVGLSEINESKTEAHSPIILFNF